MDNLLIFYRMYLVDSIGFFNKIRNCYERFILCTCMDMIRGVFNLVLLGYDGVSLYSFGLLYVILHCIYLMIFKQLDYHDIV
jgi:hypothetical protein